MAAAEPRLIAVPTRPAADFVREARRVWDGGGAVLPLDPALPARERERLVAELRPGREPVPPGTAVVVPSSGTTGTPKGVILSHEALTAAARASAQRLGSAPDDRWLCCLSLSHVAGLAILFRSTLAGVPPVILDRFDPSAIAVEERANLIAVVPTMLSRLLHARVDLARFRRVLVGGGPIDDGLLQSAGDAGARVTTTYGMTETCGGVVYDGTPLDGVEIALSPEGVIAIRGPMLMTGYRGRLDLTAEAMRDGWFRTHDLGAFDSSGRIVVAGRTDDVIITGGEKVNPEEVEKLLQSHPLVAEAVVVGRPDPEWGERVTAVVVPRPGAATPRLEDIRDFVRFRAIAYKAPADLVLVTEIPKLPSGKPARRRLLDELRSRRLI